MSKINRVIVNPPRTIAGTISIIDKIMRHSTYGLFNKSKTLHDDSGWESLLDALNDIGDDDPYSGYLPLTPGVENDKPYISQGEIWKKEGKCPSCGELGHFSQFQYVCSKHGPY